MLVAQRRTGRGLSDTEGNIPDREPGEEDIRFDDELPGGDLEYVTAEEEMPEEIAWVQQMNGGLPTIVRQNPRVQRIGLITFPAAKPGVLIGLGSVGMVSAVVGGFIMIRE